VTQDSRAYEQSRSCYHLNGPKSALPEVSRVHTRTSLDQAKSVELTAFACAFPRLIWATWATRWPEFQAVRSRASTNQTIFGTDEILARNRPRGSEIVDAVFQSEKSIRGEPVESCKLRYFNSFEFFDHTGSAPAITFRTSERHATSGTGQKQGQEGQTPELSLALIGNASGRRVSAKQGCGSEAFFDKEASEQTRVPTCSWQITELG